MRALHYFMALLLLMAQTNLSQAEQYETHSNLAQQIAHIMPRHSQIALLAQDLDNNQVIYQQQADTLFIPASTQKLLTAVTALSVLGSEFRFVTELWVGGNIQANTLIGDLYLRFNGDPTLTQEDLKVLFSHLTKQGINHIQGNIHLIGDKQEQLQAPGWVWDDLGICYAAPVSSYIINQNCVYGQFSPADTKANNATETKPARATLRAGSYGVTLKNDALFSPNASQDFCQLDLMRLGQNQYHLRGCYPGREAIPLAIAITDPQKFAKDSVDALIKGTLSLSGRILIDSHLPEKARLFSSHSSAPLPELLKTMLLKSDNLIADSLFKRVGQDYFNDKEQTPASFTQGAMAMRRILTELGIDLTSANIVDGSGLSRYNLLSAKQLADVLTLIYRDPRFNSLLGSLPEAGISGTLKYRRGFVKPPLKQRIFAKTGSMQGVANLAGFIRLPSKRDILFVVLENGISPATKKLQRSAFSADFLTQLLNEFESVSSVKQAPPKNTSK